MLWLRVLLDRLEDHKIINKIEYDSKEKYLIIYYGNYGYTERFYLERITKKYYNEDVVKRILTSEDAGFHGNFNCVPLYPNSNYLSLPKYYDDCQIDQKIQSAYLFDQICDNIDNIDLPITVASKNWNKINNNLYEPKTLKTRIINNEFIITALYFSKIDHIFSAQKFKYAMYRLYSWPYPINTLNIFKMIYSKYLWPINSYTYGKLLLNLKVNKVLDLYPFNAMKALICAKYGITYSCIGNFDHALNKDIINFSGLKYEPYDVKNKYDILLADEIVQCTINKDIIQQLMPQYKKLLIATKTKSTNIQTNNTLMYAKNTKCLIVR